MAIGGAVSQGEFDRQKNFVKMILNHFDISRSKTRVGLLHYGKDTIVVQSLKDSFNSYATLPLLDKIPHENPGMNLLKALHTADRMFIPGNGERPDAKKILIIFVDSLRDSHIPELKSLVSSLTRRNVRIILVGFEGYVQSSAVKMLLGSGRSPILVSSEYQLNDRIIVNQVIGQLRKGKYSVYSIA